MNIGIEKNNIDKCVDILSHYLADIYSLYFKTHTFHWNVTGPHFSMFHKLFDEQYNALFASIDEIAERIRVLGSLVPASYSKFQSMSCLKEARADIYKVDTTKPNSEFEIEYRLVKELLEDHETVICNLRKWISQLGELNDVAGQDFLTGRLAEHEKMAWFLRAHVSNS